MTTKFVSQLDRDGYFIGVAIADESPREPGVYLLPAGAIDVEPPVVPEGKRARYVGGSFVLEDIPAPPPEPEPVVPSDLEKAQRARASAYKNESDPLFFKAQRGEATMEEWLAKVDEIKARYPYPAA